MDIQYLKGDATTPTTTGNKIIVHICNDIGAWGKGFVVALSKKWKAPEKEYKAWAKSGEEFQLGEVQFVQVESDIWVANMIGQKDIKRKGEQSIPPIRYDAVEQALSKVSTFAKQHQATVHMPRIGCGLAGGTWDKMGPIINNELVKNGIAVTVYDFE